MELGPPGHLCGHRRPDSRCGLVGICRPALCHASWAGPPPDWEAGLPWRHGTPGTFFNVYLISAYLLYVAQEVLSPHVPRPRPHRQSRHVAGSSAISRMKTDTSSTLRRGTSTMQRNICAIFGTCSWRSLVAWIMHLPHSTGPLPSAL